MRLLSNLGNLALNKNTWILHHKHLRKVKTVSSFVSFGIYIYAQYFFDAKGNQNFLKCCEKSNFNHEISTRVMQKKIKS